MTGGNVAPARTIRPGHWIGHKGSGYRRRTRSETRSWIVCLDSQTLADLPRIVDMLPDKPH
jgi:hypothetical protein